MRDCQLRNLSKPALKLQRHQGIAPRFFPVHLLLAVLHAARRVVLLLDGSAALLVRGNLLVLLDEIADAAAAGSCDVDEAAALQVVLGANLGALHGHGNPVQTEAAAAAEEEAL